MNLIRTLRLLRAYLIARRFYGQYPHLTRDVAFHPEMNVQLDVYAPPGPDASHPVLVFVHGGGWSEFNKKLFAPAAMKFLPEGMVVVIPDHTLYPHARYEQMTREVAAAISWTLENIAQYGGDPGRVVLCGHSSGGHLVGLALMDPRFLPAYGHTASEVHGVIYVSSGHDLEAQYAYEQARGGGKPTKLMRTMEGVMEGGENFPVASPIHYIRPDLPPALVLHGDADQTVSVDQAVKFHAALQNTGAPSEIKVYPGRGHSEILFSALVEQRAQIVSDIAAFVHTGKVSAETD